MKRMCAFFTLLLTALAGQFLGSPALASPLGEAAKTDTMIQAGDVVLGATLYRPAGADGDLPVIVTAHGSAPSTREMVGFYTNLGLRMGFAVLSFDKRGTGESTGEYQRFTVENSPRIFADLASDVGHAVRWVAAQPGIDETRIGVMGGSQAGWIMPLAASQEPLIKFMIAGAGVPLSAGEEHAFEMYVNALEGEESRLLSWQELSGANALVAGFAGHRGFDPAPTLEQSEIPMLWIFGLYDQAIPTIPSIHRIGVLQQAGKRNHSIHVLPFANHNFSNVFTGERYDLLAVSEPWLRAIGILSNP